MRRTLTTDEFIKRAKSIHGNKYDYSKVNYTGSFATIKIICPIHGEFEQKPVVHLQGSGCKKCGIESIKSKLSLTFNEFISKARQAHGDKYQYNEFDFKIGNKIPIICPEHGEFKQRTENHLFLRQGCPKCSVNITRNNNSYNTSKFIELARKTHKDRYDYSKVNYINMRTKVKIICPIHGEFLQTPASHLVSRGCPKCSRNKYIIPI